MRFLIPLICSTTLVLAHEDESERIFDRFFSHNDGWTFQLHSDIESRYASEGRDALDGDSLATGTLEAAWNAVSLGLWYGKSPDQSYDELQLSTALSWEWKGLEYYCAYTHLRFPKDGGHDHEIGAGKCRRQVARRGEQPQHCSGFRHAHLAELDALPGNGFDRPASLLHGRALHVVHPRLEASRDGRVRDAMPHRPGAEHRECPNHGATFCSFVISIRVSIA